VPFVQGKARSTHSRGSAVTDGRGGARHERGSGAALRRRMRPGAEASAESCAPRRARARSSESDARPSPRSRPVPDGIPGSRSPTPSRRRRTRRRATRRRFPPRRRAAGFTRLWQPAPRDQGRASASATERTPTASSRSTDRGVSRNHGRCPPRALWSCETMQRPVCTTSVSAARTSFRSRDRRTKSSTARSTGASRRRPGWRPTIPGSSDRHGPPGGVGCGRRSTDVDNSPLLARPPRGVGPVCTTGTLAH
jgi:hypothetical protein